MKKYIFFIFLFFHDLLFASGRIKDLVTFKGVRENHLIGYGLVIGLNGTGDGGGEILNASLTRMFQKLGLNPKQEIASKNVASVIVTAKLPPFARIGQKIDITISSIGEAQSLAGGTLLITPLKAGDSQVYAMAQGQITVGGLKNGSVYGTIGKISSGATVEREVPSDFDNKTSLRLALQEGDFTTAHRIERTINNELGGKFAIAKDSTTIDVIVPPNYQRKIVELIALIENFKVNPDQKAKIVINERTGTIVAGGEIILKNVAIGHKNLSIEIKNNDDQEEGPPRLDRFYNINKETTLGDLVKALNAFGATPEDLISIFEALKSNGALTGEIEFI